MKTILKTIFAIINFFKTERSKKEKAINFIKE